MKDRLSRRHVVLLGVGHTNAHVLRMWRMQAPADTDLTCLSNFTVATYSGMLPAVLAGQAAPAEMEIDLVRLCEAVSARLITDAVVGLDTKRREIRFASRPSIPFDVLSIGVGSVPSFQGVQLEGDSLIRIKPMQTFLQRLESKIKSCDRESCRSESSGPSPLHVLIVGSGVAGLEIAFCLPNLITSITDRPIRLSIVTRSETIAPDLCTGTRRRLLNELKTRQIALMTGSAVTSIRHGAVVIDDGAELQADLVVWATGAAPPPLLDRLDLARDQRGFLQTDRFLQSTSLPGVFAVGDTGSIRGEDLPKAGVYAVRQGPILWENITRSLAGQTLRPYQPQRSFLKLINLGDGRAIGQWKSFAFSGRWVMRWKHRIDTQFMQKYRVGMGIPTMQMEADGNDELATQCRGCGCKLGGDILDSALALSSIETDRTYAPEDAVEIPTGHDQNLLASTDFFSSPFRDPFLAGRIAALHSASDLIASAGLPTAALANVVLPAGDTESQRRALADLLAGAQQEFEAMGAAVVAGHTIIGPRMELGFTVIGRPLGKQLVRKGNLQTGDQLFLTKPLGIGVLLAAHMQSRCHARDYERLIATMLQPLHPWARIAADLELTAGTDITGFGLSGHLLEMLQASQRSATIEIGSVPTLPGANERVAEGIESTLAPANRHTEERIDTSPACRQHPAYPLLFDPQTCGGLLWGVPREKVQPWLATVQQMGLPTPIRIGQVEAEWHAAKPLRVVT